MKKILTIVILLTLFGFTSTSTFNITETISDLEDMKEWMQYDIKTEAVDSVVGVLYISKIDICIQRLSQ